MLVNNQHGIKRRGHDFDKKLVFEEVHRKEVDRQISREKLDKACGINKLLKKLRDTGTVDRRPGSGRPRSARVEENVEAVNDLVSSQECKLQTHRTVREVPRETSIHRYTQN